MMRRATECLLAVCLVSTAVSVAGAQQRGVAPTRVILFIGDGVGLNYWTAALFAADALNVQQFPVVGLVDTRATNSRVTDSAASATALAAGILTYNGAIGVGPDSQAVQTVLEVAQGRGMSTGLVATSRITHATPASFAAHVIARNMEFEIARQLAEHDVTVVLGGGRGLFDRAYRPDTLDLLDSIRQRYSYVETPEELAALRPDTIEMLFGMFAESHMAAAAPRYALQANPDTTMPPDTVIVPPRAPTLSAMTGAALAVLDRDRDGFFLMVEASQPDWRGHENATLDALTAEMLDFDASIGEALRYQELHPETLVLVVADHETGGMALHYDQQGTFGAHYTTVGHSASMIPMFAKGPGAQQFGGIMTHARVGQLLMAQVRTGRAAGGR